MILKAPLHQPLQAGDDPVELREINHRHYAANSPGFLSVSIVVVPLRLRMNRRALM